MYPSESWYQIFEQLQITVINRESFTDSKDDTVLVASIRLRFYDDNGAKLGLDCNLCSDEYPSKQKILKFIQEGGYII